MNSEHDSARAVEVKPRSFGARLQDERLRLGLTQTEMAEIGGVKRTTQHIYESDIRVPDLNYLGRVRDAGADLRYLVLGVRQDAGAITFTPSSLTSMYRVVDEICVDSDGKLLPLETRVRVFQVLCASSQVQGGATTNIEALREEFARFAGT